MSLLFHVAYKRHLARNDLNRGSEECPSFFPTLDHDQQLKTIGQRILATSAIASKREYCADYKPLREALTAQTIGIQVAKAGVVTFAVAMQEYNVYLDKVIAAQAAEDAGEKVTPVEDFDWKAAQSKYLASFYTSANRFVSTFVLRKVYESLAVAHLNARIADRLCKDVLKSVKRKLQRYGRVRACVSIIPTAFYSNFVMYAASLTYDIVSFVPSTVRISRQPRSPFFGYTVTIRLPGTAAEVGAWLNKKIIFYSVCSASSAVGFALGAYFSEDYGANVVQTVLETLTAVVAATNLGL